MTLNYFNLPIMHWEKLKECVFNSREENVPDSILYTNVKKMFENPNYRFDDGETFAECQKRIISAMDKILDKYNGKKIAIGTHGLITAILLNYYDKQYDYDFLLSMSKPDVYKLTFNKRDLLEINNLKE